MVMAVMVLPKLWPSSCDKVLPPAPKAIEFCVQLIVRPDDFGVIVMVRAMVMVMRWTNMMVM